MSAAKRVAHAAETIRARWERSVESDPQTEGAQALEDTCQLLDPEVAAELASYRALELGDLDGRVSASCEDPKHPTWLRAKGDQGGCPWCRIAELEAQRERRRIRLVALQNDALNMRGSLSPMGEDRKVPFPLGETLTPAVDWLIGRVAELEARPSPADVLRQAADDLTAACPDHGDADEAWMDCPCEFADELRRKAALFESGEDACTCPVVDRPGPHQVGCPLDGVPGPDERPVNGLTAVFSPVASLREPEPEFHAFLYHPYTKGHDRPETGGASGSGACEGCGSLPGQWCPDCGCCQKGCFGGHADNPCGHASAPWGGAK